MINTVSKFGTILPGENTRVKFPHLKTRYRVRFIGFGEAGSKDGVELSLDMEKCDTPKGSFTSQDIKQVNGTVHYAGEWKWDDVSFSIFNTYDNAAYAACYSQIQKQRDLAEQTTGTVSQNYKFTTFFEHTDGHQNAMATWVMEGCILLKAQTSGGENQSHEAMIIDCTMCYDNATLYDYNGKLLTGKLLDSTLQTKILAV